MGKKVAHERINHTGFNRLAFLCAAGVLVFGSSSAIAVKSMGMMDPVPARPGGPPIVFDHTYMTSFFLFVGEACSLILYGLQHLIIRVYRKNHSKGVVAATNCNEHDEKKKSFRICPHSSFFILPTIFDLGATVALNFSIFYVVVSVQQTISNFVVVLVALFSLVFWRDYRHQFDLPHFIGLLLITAGIAAASAVSIVYGDSIGTSRNAPLGILLGLGGTVFAALCFVCEEVFLRKIQVPGMVGVGIEGTWGICICACLVAVMNFIPDPSRVGTSDNGRSNMLESTIEWAYQIRQQPIQISFIVIYALSTLFFNLSGMEVTRRISSATRATFNSCRAIIVWLFSLGIKWEQWNTPGSIIMVFGYTMLILGTLIFNNIFKIIPYCRQKNIDKYGFWMGRARHMTEQPTKEAVALISDKGGSSNDEDETITMTL